MADHDQAMEEAAAPSVGPALKMLHTSAEEIVRPETPAPESQIATNQPQVPVDAGFPADLEIGTDSSDVSSISGWSMKPRLKTCSKVAVAEMMTLHWAPRSCRLLDTSSFGLIK